MSCRLWVMLIFIIFQSKFKIMAFNYIENCFYEKRLNTALHGYNDIHDRWISDFDCFNRCLRTDSEKCRSFEHWHQNRHGLCIRANISLTDYPLVKGHNQFVDYYEIVCEVDIKAVQPILIHCPDNQLFLTIKLNDIDPHNVLLGDNNCQPNWSNETHAKFITHIDNCSLILTNDSIIGKLRWESLSEETNSVKNYERFFICQSNLYQIRLNNRTSTTPQNKNILPMLPNHQIYDDEQHLAYRITLEWTSHNRSYFCPKSCFISLYSFINITIGDSSLISSRFLIDSCDLIALPPYTNYLKPRRLIYQGCSTDPTVIYVPKKSSPLSIFHFSFHLYHILKEPIPFEIQCKILQHDEQIKFQHNIDCSSSFIDTNHLSIKFNDKRDYSYILFRSLSIHVTRQIPLIEYKQEIFPSQNSILSIATVHYIECSLYAFFVLILYTI